MKCIPLVAKNKGKLMLPCADESVWKIAVLCLVSRNVSGDTL